LRLHISKGQEFRVSVPKGEITVRVVKEDKNDTEIPRPDNTKINGAKLLMDGTLKNVVV
jgi:hypothetical protein